MSLLPSPERAYLNPFGSLVGQPLYDQLDVADINTDAFEACQRLVTDVASGGFSSAALTVFGDAGTGKTHLIGRVRSWLEHQPGNLFVFVRLETSPAGIWRHLRRSIAVALLRPDSSGVRPIDSLLNRRRGDLEAISSRDLSIVLDNLLEGKHLRDSAAWLRGEGLPDEVLQWLHISKPEADDDPEAASRQFVMAICELLRPGAVVFCMDQIEAVMCSHADRDGLHAFGKLLSCLVDETRNAAIICCVQSAMIDLLEAILDLPSKDRMMARRAAIHPLSYEQAKCLIGARLNSIESGSYPGFWTVAEPQVQKIFVHGIVPARKVIARCKDLFDVRMSGKKPVSEPLDKALQEMLDQRFADKSAAETEAILRNGIPLLARAVHLPCSIPGNRSPLDFSLNDGKVSVAICNHENLTSLAGRLKKITHAWKGGPNQSLLLLRDARLPLKSTAKASKQHIDNLQKQGGQWLTVSQEAVAALAALRRLLSDAESGDLAHQGESVSPGEVEHWIAGHLPAALGALVSEFGTAAPPATDLTPRLAALLADKKMVTLAEAARQLQAAIEEVEACARSDPRQFGILGGGIPALFQPLSISATT